MNESNTFVISTAVGAVDEMTKVTPNNFRSSIPVLLLGFALCHHSHIKAIERDLPFDTERALSTTQLSYQPQEAVLFSCSLRANPTGTPLTSTLEPAARRNY